MNPVKLLCFVYESINKLYPYCVHDFFLLNSNIHEYFTRKSNRADVFRNCKNDLQYDLKSSRYTGTETWNEFQEMLEYSSL